MTVHGLQRYVDAVAHPVVVLDLHTSRRFEIYIPAALETSPRRGPVNAESDDSDTAGFVAVSRPLPAPALSGTPDVQSVCSVLESEFGITSNGYRLLHEGLAATPDPTAAVPIEAIMTGSLDTLKPLLLLTPTQGFGFNFPKLPSDSSADDDFTLISASSLEEYPPAKATEFSPAVCQYVYWASTQQLTAAKLLRCAVTEVQAQIRSGRQMLLHEMHAATAAARVAGSIAAAGGGALGEAEALPQSLHEMLFTAGGDGKVLVNFDGTTAAADEPGIAQAPQGPARSTLDTADQWLRETAVCRGSAVGSALTVVEDSNVRLKTTAAAAAAITNLSGVRYKAELYRLSRDLEEQFATGLRAVERLHLELGPAVENGRVLATALAELTDEHRAARVRAEARQQRIVECTFRLARDQDALLAEQRLLISQRDEEVATMREAAELVAVVAAQNRKLEAEVAAHQSAKAAVEAANEAALIRVQDAEEQAKARVLEHTKVNDAVLQDMQARHKTELAVLERNVAALEVKVASSNCAAATVRDENTALARRVADLERALQDAAAEIARMNRQPPSYADSFDRDLLLTTPTSDTHPAQTPTGPPPGPAGGTLSASIMNRSRMAELARQAAGAESVFELGGMTHDDQLARGFQLGGDPGRPQNRPSDTVEDDEELARRLQREEEGQNRTQHRPSNSVYDDEELARRLQREDDEESARRLQREEEDPSRTQNRPSNSVGDDEELARRLQHEEDDTRSPSEVPSSARDGSVHRRPVQTSPAAPR